MEWSEGFFEDLLALRGISLSDQQKEQFELYFEELVEWNEKMNLTAITEKRQVYLKHFYDSLTLGFYVPLHEVKQLADIGAGAGFPGIPNKILHPHLELTIIDSLNKRILFLEHLKERLNLKDVHCVHARAEEAGRSAVLRDSFDLVSARAVARLNVLNELCLPFVRKGGMFAAMKGPQTKEELEEADKSTRALQGKLSEVHTFMLPEEQSERNIVLIRKTGDTPQKYPRKPGTPAKDPIR